MGSYDWGAESATAAIVNAVSTEVGCEPNDLDPLYESIDPDAIDQLFSEGRLADGRIEFTYEGYDVTVRSDTVVVGTESADDVEACDARTGDASGKSSV